MIKIVLSRALVFINFLKFLFYSFLYYFNILDSAHFVKSPLTWACFIENWNSLKMLLKSFGHIHMWVSPDVFPLPSVEVGLRPPRSFFAGGTVPTDPEAPGSGLSSLMSPFRDPCLHRHLPMRPPTNNGIQLQCTAGLGPYYPTSSPRNLCSQEVFTTSEDSPLPQSLLLVQRADVVQATAVPASPRVPQHSPGGSSWTRGGGGSALLLFPFFSLLAELASKKYQLLPLVAMALMMGRAVSWEVDWHNQFISHRSANSHQIKMIFVRYRPGLDWNQWPGDERLRKKGFYFVYGHTSLLSPPHSFSCPKLFLFFFFSPPQKL